MRQLQNSASKSGKWSKVRARLLPSQTSDSTVTPQAPEVKGELEDVLNILNIQGIANIWAWKI